METINKLRKFYHLKNVERSSPVGKRKESSAEHTWSALILADYFLTIIVDKDIDRLKVYELLMYHDVVEIEAGDTCISKIEERKNKKELERKAMEKLKEDFPDTMKNKVWNLFVEFEEEKTKEAKLARAIDALDAEIHFLDYKSEWKGWTPEMVRKLKPWHLVKEFPELEEAYEKVLSYAEKEGYFT
jgi:putative hydrolases of HD superfamily